jgi:hypothetical protein
LAGERRPEAAKGLNLNIKKYRYLNNGILEYRRLRKDKD